MATFTERLAILISADTRGAVRELQALGTASQRNLSVAEASAGGFSASADKAGTAMIAFGTRAVAGGAIASAGLFQVARSAAALGDSVQAADVIFGKNLSASIDRFARDAADKLGMSRREATETLTAFATFGRGANLQGQELLKFSENLTKIAVDLGSLKGISTNEVVEAISSGLGGEIDSLRRLGIQITDLQKRAEAVRLGIRDAGDKTPLTAEQNIKATASLIQSSPLGQAASGDFERTIDSLPNKLKVAQANFDNLKVSLGTGIVPVFAQLAESAAGLARAFENLPEPARNTLGTLAALGAVGSVVGGGLATIGGGAIKAVKWLSELGKVQAAAGMVEAAGAANQLATATTGAGNAATVASTKIGRLALTPGAATAAVAGLTIAITQLERSANSANLDRLFGDIDTTDADEVGAAYTRVLRSITGEAESVAEKARNALSTIVPVTGDAFAPVTDIFNRLQRGNDNFEQVLAEFKASLDGLPLEERTEKVNRFAESLQKLGQTDAPGAERFLFVQRLGAFIEVAGQQAVTAATEIAGVGTAASGTSSGLAAGASAAESYAARLVGAVASIREANADISNTDLFTQATQAAQGPARAALGYESALIRVQQAQEKLNDLSNPKNNADRQQAALDRVTSANDGLSDALERRRKAQEELDRLTRRSAVAGSVPLVQEIARAADAGVKEAQAKVDQALATYGEGSTQVAAARKGLEAAAGRRSESVGLLDRALQEQGGRNQAEVRSAQRAVNEANVDIARASRDKRDAEAEYAETLTTSAATALERRQAELELRQAVLDAEVAYSTLTGTIADGADPFGELADALTRARDAGIITNDQLATLTGSLGALSTEAQKSLGWIAPLLAALAEGQGAAGTTTGTATSGLTPVQVAQRAASGVIGQVQGAAGLAPDNNPPGLPPGRYEGTGNYRRNVATGETWVFDGVSWNRQSSRPSGGRVNRFAEGGEVSASMLAATNATVPGGGHADSVPAMLTPGEFVMTRQAVAAVGTDALKALNKGRAAVQKFATGGVVRGPRPVPTFPSGSSASARTPEPARTVEVNPNIYITSTDPEAAADESIRKLRRATFLAGVR